MTTIESYYDLLHKITISEFKISLYNKNPEEKSELENEEQTHSELVQELEIIKKQLSEKSAEADKIRTAFVHVANGVLRSFSQIKKWGSYYPDLSQGMVVPGYLFGKILTDFNIALKYEGGLPGVEIYMSQQEWDYESLETLIKKIRDELVGTNFTTKMEGVTYYEYIRSSVLEIVDSLREQRVI